MVAVLRLTVLLLAVCLLSPLPDCACGGDLFPSLRLLVERPGGVWPAAGLVEMPLGTGDGNTAEAGYPVAEWDAAAPSPWPTGDAIPPEIFSMPGVQFEPMPAGRVDGGFPMRPAEAWDDAGCLPVRPGLLGRQPLRQHLRDMYGPPQGRHRGLGQPMTSESWLYRPYSAGWFTGAMFGSPLIDDWLGISSGYFTGLRFGWDQTYYWGLETQFAYGQVGLWDSALAKADRRLDYVEKGWLADDPALDRLVSARRDLDLYQWTVSVMYYPWGDARWRPYFSVGIGASRMTFTDIFLVHYAKTSFVLPLAVGVKYHWNDWLALRVECSDSFSVPGGGGLKAVHNLSINGALEIRFGGARTAYWPWNPGRTYW